jgi:hypothetical protein
MENEGIMALPMEAPMSQQEPMTVSSAESYDAATTALGMSDPQALEAMKTMLRDELADVDFTPREIDQMIDVFEYLTRNPNDYDRVVQSLVAQDLMDPGDMPDQYDPTFIGAALAVLNEMKMGRVQGAMAPMQSGPSMMPTMQMAQGGLADMAQYLASRGRNGDTMLAHITPEEARMLQAQGGAGTINPQTGLPEYFKKFFKKLGNTVKKALSSPVGRILGTIALAAVLGPTSIGLALGKAGTAALAAGSVTLAGGGSVKEALISSALGYVGGGGDFGGLGSPLKAVGEFMPGAAGSAINTGLTTGALGTGAGLLMGMKPSEALKMGLAAGAVSGGIAGVQGAPLMGPPGPAAPAAGATGPSPAAPVPGTGGIQSVPTAQDMVSMPMAEAGQMSPLQQAAMAPGGPYGDMGPAVSPGPIGQAVTGPTGGAPTVVPETSYATPSYQSLTQPAATSPMSMTMPMSEAASTPRLADQGFFGRTVQGATDLYDKYLSPSRAGLPEDAGIIRKYGPIAAAGTAAAAALGAFKEGEVDTSAAERAKRPIKYPLTPGGAVSRVGVPSETNVLVPTPSLARFLADTEKDTPSVPAPGITRSQGAVAQPYNIAGLYGVPLIYRAQGGPTDVREFPRKNGAINGPGTGTSDSIPAMLSDGEFVFTAKAVRNAGSGSRRKGAAKMYKLMKMLEGGPVGSKA